MGNLRKEEGIGLEKKKEGGERRKKKKRGGGGMTHLTNYVNSS